MVKGNCNKRSFKKKEAEDILKSIKENSEKDPKRKEKRIYECTICKAYHLTSKSKKEFELIQTINNQKRIIRKEIQLEEEAKFFLKKDFKKYKKI